MQLPPFLIERMFAKHEFTARVNLTGSDTEALALSELWQVAPAKTRAWYESLTLGYTESPGHPDFQAAILLCLLPLPVQGRQCPGQDLSRASPGERYGACARRRMQPRGPLQRWRR